MVNVAKTYAWLGVTPSTSASADLVTSPVFSPFVLAGIRLTLAIYSLTTSIIVLAHDSITSSKHDAGGYFSYYTQLSYIGLVAYFWASGVQTLVYALRGQKSYPLQKWPQFLQFLHRLLYSSITTFPILVTIVFWTLLSSRDTFKTPFSSWSNLSQHALNTAFALFEVVLTRAGPSPWSHLIFLVVILGGYLGIAYITHATEGFYTYAFLNPQKEHGLLAAYIVGIAVAECIIFALVWGICCLRERITRTRSGRSLLDAHDPEEIEDWQDVERPDVV
jgi:hypothetical protein